MSRVTLVKSAQPSPPAAGEISIWTDSADAGRLKAIDGDTTRVTSLVGVGADRSLLGNGGFDLAQRQAPGTLTTYSTASSRVYCADRWALTTGGVNQQYQRVDTRSAPETGMTAAFYGKIKAASAAKLCLSQMIEAMNCVALRGRIVVLQAKMKRTVAASMTVRMGLLQLNAAGTVDTGPASFIPALGSTGVDPTLGTNLAYITPTALTGENGTITGNMLSCVLGTTWVRYSVVFLLPSDFKNLYALFVTDAAAVVNDELNITEVGLTAGADPQDWNPRDITLVVEQCQRYFTKSFAIDTLPAQNVGLVNAVRGNAGVAGAVSTEHMEIPFPTRMRITPATITLFNPSAANAFLRNVRAATDATVTSSSNAGDRSTNITATGLAAWAAGDPVAIHYTAEAEL